MFSAMVVIQKLDDAISKPAKMSKQIGRPSKVSSVAPKNICAAPGTKSAQPIRLFGYAEDCISPSPSTAGGAAEVPSFPAERARTGRPIGSCGNNSGQEQHRTALAVGLLGGSA